MTEKIEIHDWNDLRAVDADPEADYILMNDLDKNTDGYEENVEDPDSGWAPIEPFQGTFHGQGNQIRDLEIDAGTTDIGLFERIEGGVVDNLHVEADITADFYTGILAYSLEDGGKIINCSTDGPLMVAGPDGRAGGLVGQQTEDSEITQSFSSAEIIDENNNSIQMGGLVGWAGVGENLIEKSYATGDVEGDSEVGGLVGQAEETSVKDSYATGDVEGDSEVGGLIGASVGLEGIEVEKCYATGAVSGESYYGGLIGRVAAPSIVENSFWDIETSGVEFSDGGTGKTTAEMKDIATYIDTDTEGLDEPWDIASFRDHDDETWGIGTGEKTYPRLQHELEIKEYESEFYTNESIEWKPITPASIREHNQEKHDIVRGSYSLKLEELGYIIEGDFDAADKSDADAYEIIHINDEDLNKTPGKNVEYEEHKMIYKGDFIYHGLIHANIAIQEPKGETVAAAVFKNGEMIEISPMSIGIDTPGPENLSFTALMELEKEDEIEIGFTVIQDVSDIEINDLQVVLK